jgi:cytochrome c peroxidase
MHGQVGVGAWARPATRFTRYGIGVVAAIATTAVLGSALIAGDRTQRETVPLGLPSLPPSALASPERIELGRELFFDRRLSFNSTLSCGMCHIEGQAFASTQSSTAVGFEGKSLRRNAPSLLNVVYQKSLFHDGRELELSQQVWLPFLAHDEMANPSISSLIERIRGLSDYDGKFEKAFAGRPPSMETIGEALAAYERTLLSGNSRFDQWYFGKVESALSAPEKRGFAIFVGKGKCATCHLIGEKSALFTDHKFHNTGIGYRATMGRDLTARRVQVAPDDFITINDELIRSVKERLQNDVGRFEITLNPEDRWAYKTPSLRDVSKTQPYMHDGSLFTLEEVVAYYNRGGVPHSGLDESISPLNLSKEDEADLVAFLKSLDGTAVRSSRRDY